MLFKQTKKYVILVSLFFGILMISGCQKNNTEVLLITSTNEVVLSPSVMEPTEIIETPTEVVYEATPTSTSTATLLPSPTATQGPLAWRIPALEYHNPTYFGGENVRMTAEWFNEQIDWLGENDYKTLNNEELLGFIGGSYQPQQKSVVLRFDIGVPEYDEYANIVIPALRRNNLHALLFLIVPSLTDDCQHPENRICWGDLKEWEEEGLISIGSHGMDHPDYANISKAYASQDAGYAKNIIEDKLGHSIDLFAYPFDSVPANPRNILLPLNYAAGFTGWPENQDRSIVFGSQLFWKIPSYYPYSGDDYYPVITTSGPYFGSTFAELITQAIFVSDEEISELSRNKVTVTPTPDFVIQPSATPTEIAIQEVIPTLVSDEDPYLQYYLYCKNYYNEILNINYLQSVAFPTDISMEAQNLLNSTVLVKPVCHFDENNKPEAVVLHYTGSLANYEGSLTHFRDPNSGTSAHYIVERDGTVIQLLPENYVANHVSCYSQPAVNCLKGAPLIYDENGNYTRPATRSIGIEIVNAGPLVYPDKSPDVLTDKFETPFEGEAFVYEDFDPYGRYKYEFWEPYPEAQLEALEILINDIMARWGFDLVVGHNELQENIDPGPALKDFIDSFK